MKRDLLIKKIQVLLDTCSDEQLKLLDEAIKSVIYTEKFSNLRHQESRNFTKSNAPFAREDVDEGNYGTLYRSVE